MDTNNNNNIINHVKNNWVIYAFIVQLITNYAINNVDHIQFKKDILELQEYRNSETILLTEMQKDIASIKTSIIYIEKNLK